MNAMGECHVLQLGALNLENHLDLVITAYQCRNKIWMGRCLYSESRNTFFNVHFQIDSLSKGNGKRTPESQLNFFHVQSFTMHQPPCSEESFKVGKHPLQTTTCPFRQRSVNPTVNIKIDARVDRVVQSKGFGLDFDLVWGMFHWTFKLGQSHM